MKVVATSTNGKNPILRPLLIETLEIHPIPQPVDPSLELNCWFIGPALEPVIPVKISRTASVAALRRAIKKEKHRYLAETEADALELWKVTVPDDEPPEQTLSRLTAVDELPLPSLSVLSDIFPDLPTPLKIHIRVRISPSGEYNVLLDA